MSPEIMKFSITSWFDIILLQLIFQMEPLRDFITCRWSFFVYNLFPSVFAEIHLFHWSRDFKKLPKFLFRIRSYIKWKLSTYWLQNCISLWSELSFFAIIWSSPDWCRTTLTRPPDLVIIITHYSHILSVMVNILANEIVFDNG